MKLEVARPLGALLIAVAAFIMVIPFMNVGWQVWPWKFADSNWRFGAWGFLLGALTLPTLGLGLLAIGGVLRDSAGVLRTVLLLSSLLGLLVLVGVADFVTAGLAFKQKITDPKLLLLYSQELRRTTLICGLALPALVTIAITSGKLIDRFKAMVAQRADPLLHIGQS